MQKIQVAALLALVATLPCTSARAESITTTLLPLKTVPSEELTISTEKSVPTSACLQFDLGPVARSNPTEITAATLRVIGTSDVENAQVVRVFEANEQCTGPKTEQSAASWIIRASGEEARARSSGLIELINEARKKEPYNVRLFLRSENQYTKWNYGSAQAYDSMKKPRLIVSFKVEKAAEISSGDTTDWIFYSDSKPPMVDKTEIFKGLLPNSEPLIYGDDVIVIAKDKLERLSTQGLPRWSGALVPDPGTRAAIDRQGWLYNFGADKKLRVFDLENSGAEIGEVQMLEMTALETELTIAPGGNIYFATSGTSAFIYGLTPWTGAATPSLQEIWRSGITGGGATNVVVSPPGPDFLTYTLANKGFFALDAATGTKSVTSEWNADSKRSRLNPVVSAGPEHDYAILAAAGRSNGIVGAFSGEEWYWTEEVAPSQPTIDQADEPCKSRVVAIAGGRFTRMNLCNGMKGKKENEDWCQSKERGLAATSNILLDGESNAYFWNNGKFYIYSARCERVLEQPVADLAANLTLRFAADGSVITRHGTNLYALQRRVAGTTLTIGNAQLKDGYAYVGNAVRVSANTTLTAGTRVLLRGKQGVGFGNGFRVQSGAELSVQAQ